MAQAAYLGDERVGESESPEAPNRCIRVHKRRQKSEQQKAPPFHVVLHAKEARRLRKGRKTNRIISQHYTISEAYYYGGP